MARELKDSGIEWIGQIPKDWEVPRLKNVAELHGRIGWNGLRSDEFEENSYAYLVTGQDFKTSEIVWNNCYQIRKERYDEDPFIQLHNGEILVTKDGTIGKIAIVSKMDKPGCLNSGIFVLRQKIDAFAPKYLYWQLYSTLLKTYNDYMNLGGTTIVHLYQNVFERMPLLAPSISEQQKIADYLDKVCGEVDEMVTLQETMIEELKAYKQSVITEAVTKGLNPKVPMRNSGIDWIGEIPEHWDTGKTLYVLSLPITDGPHTTPDLFDDGVPFISADAVSDGYINFDNKRGFVSKEFYDECCKKYIPQLYDVYMIKSGASTGRTAIVETQEIFTIWSPLAVFRANPEVMTPYYLLYMLRSDGYQKQVETFWSYGTQQNIGMRTLEKLIVCIPPLSEQRAIATYLDTKCSEIDSLIALKQAKVEELKEYKKSVIYEYVTGKKEVHV